MLQKLSGKKRSNLHFLLPSRTRKESRSSYYAAAEQYRAVVFVPRLCRRSNGFLVDCLPHPGPGFGRTPRDGFDVDADVVYPKQSRRVGDRGSRVTECADSVGLVETVGPASNRLPVGDSCRALAFFPASVP